MIRYSRSEHERFIESQPVLPSSSQPRLLPVSPVLQARTSVLRTWVPFPAEAPASRAPPQSLPAAALTPRSDPEPRRSDHSQFRSTASRQSKQRPMMLMQVNVAHGPPQVARDQRSLRETRDQSAARTQAGPRHSTTTVTTRLQHEGPHDATRSPFGRVRRLRDDALSPRESWFLLGVPVAGHQSMGPSRHADGSPPPAIRTARE